MLGRAIRFNILPEPRWKARLNNAFIRWAFSQPVPRGFYSINKDENPEQNPKTQRYWEHTFGLMEAPSGTTPWVIELARISIPDSFVGVCKGFEQFVDVEGESPVTTSDDWGNPFILPDEIRITWYFRLERCDTGEPPQINASSVSPMILLPGEPHFDVSEMRDLWFPAASPPSQSFHMTVGGRYRLRILAIVERDEEYDIGIAAKIRGFRISSFGIFSNQSIRSIW